MAKIYGAFLQIGMTVYESILYFFKKLKKKLDMYITSNYNKRKIPKACTILVSNMTLVELDLLSTSKVINRARLSARGFRF